MWKSVKIIIIAGIVATFINNVTQVETRRILIIICVLYDNILNGSSSVIIIIV